MERKTSNSSLIRQFIIKRYKTASSVQYSFETCERDGGVILFWAQYKFGGRPMYIVSANIEDLGKPREERSTQFLGKLDTIEYQRLYVGYLQSAIHGDKVPCVSVLYDHNRQCTVDRKMEVAVPLIPMDHMKSVKSITGLEESVQVTNPFLSLFMQIRREGQENVVSKDEVMILVQDQDSKEVMNNDAVLTGQLAGIATCCSTKNFSLKLRQPSRQLENNDILPTPITSRSTIVPTSRISTPLNRKEYLMQFGKRNTDIYYCQINSKAITDLIAFMIILSRFDTIQKY